MSGVGNTVFLIPSSVSRLHIVGTYTGNSANFIVWVGPPNVACGNIIASGCALIVNDLLGTAWPRTVSDGVYQMTGQTQVNIIGSDGVAWTFTQE